MTNRYEYSGRVLEIGLILLLLYILTTRLVYNDLGDQKDESRIFPKIELSLMIEDEFKRRKQIRERLEEKLKSLKALKQ